MLTNDQSFAYAFFSDERAAAAAVRKLIDSGFDSEHIGVLMRGETEPREVPLEHKTGVGPGAAIGSMLGVVAGAVGLPATGVIALGGVFATAGGAAVGGAAGTLMGALGGLGIWKDKIAVPPSAFEQGDVLVGALTTPERANTARSALSASGARETKLATRAEAESDLEKRPAAVVTAPTRAVNPDRLARNVFLWCLAYVIAVAASIWLFIRPV